MLFRVTDCKYKRQVNKQKDMQEEREMKRVNRKTKISATGWNFENKLM